MFGHGIKWKWKIFGQLKNAVLVVVNGKSNYCAPQMDFCTTGGLFTIVAFLLNMWRRITLSMPFEIKTDQKNGAVLLMSSRTGWHDFPCLGLLRGCQGEEKGGPPCQVNKRALNATLQYCRLDYWVPKAKTDWIGAQLLRRANSIQRFDLGCGISEDLFLFFLGASSGKLHQSARICFWLFLST